MSAIQNTSIKRKTEADSFFKGFPSQVVLFALNIRACLWKYIASGQVDGWRSEGQISSEWSLVHLREGVR